MMIGMVIIPIFSIPLIIYRRFEYLVFTLVGLGVSLILSFIYIYIVGFLLFFNIFNKIPYLGY